MFDEATTRAWLSTTVAIWSVLLMSIFLCAAGPVYLGHICGGDVANSARDDVPVVAVRPR